jgi:16S rRNA processing protein RimM
VDTSDLIAVGEIIKPQGIKGELKVIPLTYNIKRFGEIHRVFWKTTDRLTDGLTNGLRELFLEGYRPFKSFVLLKFTGIDSLTEAERLGRGLIYIPRSERPKLPEGQYYLDEIEGLEVYTIAGEHLGKITQILQTGSNDVYCVAGTNREILIPALKHVISAVLLDQGRMVVELPAGLLEDER